jgi:hypothetical protein
MTGPTPPSYQEGTPPPYPGPGQPPWAGQPPAYYPPPAPPRGSRRGLVIGLVAGAVVLMLLCGVGVVVAARLIRQRNTDPLGTVVDYRNDPVLQDKNHRDGPISYPHTPPVGGPHHAVWQNCDGDVYTSPLDNGYAVHSLEHGAVWITYRPDLDPAEVSELRQRVQGGEYIFLSPYPEQPTKVSLQAWGYQMRLDSVDDRAIDAFITAYKGSAAPEPGASCSRGWTDPAG